MKTKVIGTLFFIMVLLAKFNIYNIMPVCYAYSVILECHVISLAVNPKQPDDVYVNIYDTWNRPMGLHKSTDGGENWHFIPNLPEKTMFNLVYDSTVAISPYDSRIIYAGRSKSTDGGKTWSPSGLSDKFSYMTIHPLNTSIVYAIVGTTLNLTTGDNYWLGIKRRCSAFAMDYKKPYELYAYCEGEAGEGVYKSVDSGLNWRMLLPVNSGFSWDILASATFTPNYAIRTLAHDSTNSIIYAAGRQNIYRSVDGGQRWETISMRGFPDDRRIYTLTIDPVHSDTLYIGTNYGVFKSTDRGYSWHRAGEGLLSNAHTLVVNPQNPDIIYAGTLNGGVFKSINGGKNWRPVNKRFPCYQDERGR